MPATFCLRKHNFRQLKLLFSPNRHQLGDNIIYALACLRRKIKSVTERPLVAFIEPLNCEMQIRYSATAATEIVTEASVEAVTEIVWKQR